MTEPRHRLGKRPPIWALPRDRTLSNLRFLTLAALPPSLLRQRVNSLIMTRWLRGPLCRRVVFALAALFQLSCRFIEKHLSYRTNANAGADSRIWRAAAKLISDGQHPSSMGFQRLCVAANLRTHRNLTVVTDNVAMFRSEIGRSLSPPLAGFPMLAAALAGHWSSRSSRLAARAPDWMSAHPRLVRDAQERRPPAFKTVSPSSKPI